MVERTPGARDFLPEPNPVTPERVLELVAQLDRPRGVHQAVSLTGGEPLLQVEFVEALAPRIRRAGLDVYLETNGSLPAALSRVIGDISTVAMDLKLPAAAGQPTDWDAAREFLEIARRTACFVKVVVTPEVSGNALADAAGLIADVDRGIPLVLQPATPHGPVKEPPSARQMLDLQAAAVELDDVRVIPQTHKLMGQL